MKIDSSGQAPGKKPRKPMLFEVCCGSAEDVIEAAKGGAGRVELNSDLFHGGLTPSIGSLRVARRSVEIPILCMVRPREGGFCYSEAEFQVMLEDARLLLENGADGIVFGFLHEDGTVDEARTARMLEVIGPGTSVFHRAIDVTPDPLAALDALIRLGVDRVLTSGQAPTAIEGAETILRMIERAAGRIEILPGGGIKLHNAARCRDLFHVPALHGTLHKRLRDSSCQSNPALHFSATTLPPEDEYKLIDAEAVASLNRILNEA